METSNFLMHSVHHGVCFPEDTHVKMPVKEATKFHLEKYKVFLCQLIILANLVKHRKALYCLQIHVMHTRELVEILCGYR